MFLAEKICWFYKLEDVYGFDAVRKALFQSNLSLFIKKIAVWTIIEDARQTTKRYALHILWRSGSISSRTAWQFYIEIYLLNSETSCNLVRLCSADWLYAEEGERR